MKVLINKFISAIQRLFRRKKSPAPSGESAPLGANNVNIIDLNHENDQTNVLDVDLINHQLSQKENKEVRQYTKIFVTSLTIVSCVWITWSYCLATYALVVSNNTQPLESLSMKVCETILGVAIVYMIKAYFETYSQKKNELIRELNQEADAKSNSVLANAQDGTDYCEVEDNDNYDPNMDDGDVVELNSDSNNDSDNDGGAVG